ncbi:ACP S-malonyltransferase [Janthinobacterium fluminis]|uniref:Malonyl CoA-acyl carrier protein transacylase n=1 Tax=Janthinobacterium fluminis TaxID=2987524 RepID=A0ABT5K2P4_9BURK|nr:ACP S-malonyltransferase [Janthinobacterium fluminis]MDC8758955.1 ACP S-malonyltransferase [Janthinobacterium fluminis]
MDTPNHAPRCAYLFPGQGAQTIGMLQDFAGHPLLQETFAAASDALDLDLWKLACEGPKAELDLTLNTQPIMLAAGFAVYRIWMAESGLQPAFLAGHSLGEYTALTAAGAIDFADAIRLVRLRAAAMTAAVASAGGGMCAILGLDATAVAALCAQASLPGDIVEAVNLNGPTQIVIAGHRGALGRAALLTRAQSHLCIDLPVSGPFHSSLMRPAADALAEHLAGISLRRPRIPVIHNYSAAPQDAQQTLADLLVKQVYNPVRWTETVAYALAHGVERMFELGPGTTLTGLARYIAPGLPCLAVNGERALQAARACLQAAAPAEHQSVVHS